MKLDIRNVADSNDGTFINDTEYLTNITMTGLVGKKYKLKNINYGHICQQNNIDPRLKKLLMVMVCDISNVYHVVQINLCKKESCLQYLTFLRT